MKTLSKTFLAALCILAAPLQAHEFWIEPEAYTVATGETVKATFRNGQEFKGSNLSYIPSRSARFDMVTGDTVQPVPARMGDNPAVAIDTAPEGLLTVLQETTEQRLTYKEWVKWVNFAEHKDFTEVLEAHRARGLPDEGFREAYLRFAKALIAVGDGAGEDSARGMRVEFVAGANPYTDDLSGGLPVQILFDGAPKANAQIEMFEKAPDDSVTVTLHRADAEGRATLPVRPGHEYLLDSVTILPLEPEAENDPVWLTLWAALTFGVPQE
ncbi:DUF4198 domain-containing protein [Jannaschia sp. M317]|uniref:DUF4198 domain-containing protein n=1 Tax=Jannaschia sp. M317 TaxID=2867011 RepID=UPI0021A78FF9|nr:DUF4198 domain-containing protein [Jannaschia sp. M317]UWQ18386.1 DUF4198 domain-containing protein [Jannaschia sp. M317]